MTAKSHPVAMRFIPDQPSQEYISRNDISSDVLAREPARYVFILSISTAVVMC